MKKKNNKTKKITDKDLITISKEFVSLMGETAIRIRIFGRNNERLLLIKYIRDNLVRDISPYKKLAKKKS